MSARTPLRALAMLGCAALCATAPDAASALAIFNAPTPADVAARRDAWLDRIHGSPQFRVDFETGFVAGQSIEAQPGLLPGGLVIRDASESTTITVEGAGSAKLGGSLPVDSLALAAGSRQIILDFSAAPVDYVAFRDLDLAGMPGDPTGAWVFPITGPYGSIASLDKTADDGASAEFFGLVVDDGLRIVQVTISAGSNFADVEWGLDDLEYGRFYVPEPGAAALLASGLAGIAARCARMRRRSAARNPSRGSRGRCERASASRSMRTPARS